MKVQVIDDKGVVAFIYGYAGGAMLGESVVSQKAADAIKAEVIKTLEAAVEQARGMRGEFNNLCAPKEGK